MSNISFCPFASNNTVCCKENNCALYDQDYEHCCFLSIAKAFDGILNSNNSNKKIIKEGTYYAKYLADE